MKKGGVKMPPPWIRRCMDIWMLKIFHPSTGIWNVQRYMLHPFSLKGSGGGGKTIRPPPLFPPLCMEHYIEKIEFVCCGGFVTVWLWLLCMYTNSILRKHRFQWKRNKIWKCVRSGDQGFRCADVKKCGTLHDFACHPCAGAMLIFSVSFQF